MPAQVHIINSVNRLFKKRGLSFEFNKKGVCAGLAAIYIKYFLEGREEKFFELSRKLANPPVNYKIGDDAEFDLFIRDIEIAFQSRSYIKGTGQGDLTKFIVIDGKPIREEFTLGLVDSEAEWSELFAKIKNEGRACNVASHNHALAVAFKNNHYVVYDPNYDEDSDNRKTQNVKLFKTAAEVMAELTNRFDYKEGDNIGIGVRIFAHPNDKTVAHYPDKKDILSRRLNTSDDFDRKITAATRVWGSLDFAISDNDLETMQHYFTHGKMSQEQAALAILRGHEEVAFNFYLTQNSQSQVQLIKDTARYGSPALLTRMITHYEQTQIRDETDRQEFITRINLNSTLLEDASTFVRRIENVKIVLGLYEKYGIKINQLNNFSAAALLNKVTEQGDAAILELLLEKTLRCPAGSVPEKISIAARKDNTAALLFWLHRLEPTSEVKQNLINQEIIENSSSLNLSRLIEKEFFVNPPLLIHALKCKDIEIFKRCLGVQKNTPWKRVLSTLVENGTLPASVNLFEEKEGLNLFQVLARLGKIDLVRQYWPEQVNQSVAENALEFACELGNVEIARFIATKGYKLSSQFQVDTLKKATESNELDVIQAICSTQVDKAAIFAKEQNELVADLIGAGEYSLLVNSWSQFTNERKSFFLRAALFYDNKHLLFFIARQEKELCLNLLIRSVKSAYEKQKPSYLVDVKKLIEILDQSEIQQLWNRGKAKAAPALAYALKYAIRNQDFVLARSLIVHVELKRQEQYELLIEAQNAGEKATVNFLIEHYGSQLASAEFLLKLETEKQYGLLATLLPQAKLLNDKLSLLFLNNAVARQDERIVKLLSHFINAGFRLQGTPLYKALSHENTEGAALLLRQGAEVNENTVVTHILTTAIKTNSQTLLFWAFENAKFRDFFNQALQENLNYLFKNAQPELIQILAGKMNLPEHFEAFLNYAIVHDNLPLFKQLQTLAPFTTVDKNQLFKLACASKSRVIANELLAYPLTFADKKEIHERLNQLFVDQDDAHKIYDLVYKKSANRLYELMITQKYRPFAALHRSISEMIADPGLQVHQRNQLIKRALDEGDGSVLSNLLNQVEKPALLQGGLELFRQNLDKPLVLQVLLEHYPLNEAIEAALNEKQWPVVLFLIRNRAAAEVKPDLIEKLKSNAMSILLALEVDAKNNLAADPRHELNALLIDNKQILPVILTEKRNEVKQLVMSLQDLMVAASIDLHRRFYRFDLEQQLMAEFKAIENIEPRIRQFLMANVANTDDDILAIKSSRDELLFIKTFMAANKLVPAYFEERDRLTDLFDAFDKLETEKLKHQAPRQSRQTEEVIPENGWAAQGAGNPEARQEKNALTQLIELVQDYNSERRKGRETRYFPPFFQFTKTEKLHAANDFIAALKGKWIISPTARAALKDGKLFRTIKQFMRGSANALQNELGADRALNSVDQLLSFLNQRNAVTALKAILTQYQVTRKGQADVYGWSIFRQFTKKDKLQAVDQLLAKLNGENVTFSVNDIAALNQGGLGDTIQSFIDDFGKDLARAKGVKEINNLDDLIACDYASELQPIDSKKQA